MRHGVSCRVVDQTAGFFRNALHRSNWTDYSCQRRKLVGERHGIGAVVCELVLADHVYQFDAGWYRAGGPERFEVEHRPSHPLDGAMVPLDNVIEVFNLTHKDRHLAAGVDRIKSRLVDATLVHCYIVRIAVRSHGLSKERFAAAMSRLAVSRK
jgi:hypothetical protein